MLLLSHSALCANCMCRPHCNCTGSSCFPRSTHWLLDTPLWVAAGVPRPHGFDAARIAHRLNKKKKNLAALLYIPKDTTWVNQCNMILSAFAIKHIHFICSAFTKQVHILDGFFFLQCLLLNTIGCGNIFLIIGLLKIQEHQETHSDSLREQVHIYQQGRLVLLQRINQNNRRCLHCLDLSYYMDKLHWICS